MEDKNTNMNMTTQEIIKMLRDIIAGNGTYGLPTAELTVAADKLVALHARPKPSRLEIAAMIYSNLGGTSIARAMVAPAREAK
jgi:hypothetical protein